jgi:hypothetical protein
MRRKTFITMGVMLLVLAFIGCSTKAKEKLNVELTQEAKYQCSIMSPLVKTE